MTGHKADALAVCGDIYRMNAPHAIGYLYNPTRDGKEVSVGMYCDRVSEIDPERWTYFVDLSPHLECEVRFYDLENKRMYNTLMNKLQRKVPA